jgi:hypothetical protein
MPVPIIPINDMSGSKPVSGVESSNYTMDYSFLADLDFATYSPTSKKFVTATNKDASALYDLWEKGKHVAGEKYNLEKDASTKSTGLSTREISRLKAMGFIKDDSGKISFTDKGKKLIVTMTLSEPNRFEQKAERKPYNEILAGMNSRTKKTGGKIKMADHNENCLDLRKIK